MSWNSKIVWSEGMFLRPHHFQQHDRYLENLINGRCRELRSHGWGVTELALDDEARALGKIAIGEARGVMPDGTPFNIPGDDDAPAPFDVPAGTTDAEIYLTLPVRRVGALEVSDGDEGGELTRYSAVDNEARDNSGADRTTADLRVGRLKLALSLDGEESGNFTRLPVARVTERRSDGMIVLDEDFIPTCLSCHADARLSGYVREILGLLRHRAESLAGRVSDAGRGGVSEFADYLLLQLINRYEPLFAHLSGIAGLHPEDFYRTGLQLAGELGTFTRPERRAPELPVYNHDFLQATFAPLVAELRRALSMVLEQNAVEMPLEERNYGVRVAQIADREMLTTAHLVLAVKSDTPTEVLVTQFPRQVKIGAVENIADLVNLQLPGVGIRQLPVAPREIPFHAGFSYFELDKKSEHWPQLLKSGGVAVHVGSDIPGVQMELWAIRG